MRDPAYLAEAKASYQDVDFTDYKGMEAVISDAYSMPPNVVKRVAQLTRTSGN